MLNEVIIQQPVFEWIHRAACLCREFFEPHPHQKSTADMMTLDARLAALAAFQPGHLCAFAGQRLDLLAEAAHLVCRRRGILRLIVAHNVVRAVGRHLNPAAWHFVVFGKAFDREPFAVGEVIFASVLSQLPARPEVPAVRLNFNSS